MVPEDDVIRDHFCDGGFFKLILFKREFCICRKQGAWLLPGLLKLAAGRNFLLSDLPDLSGLCLQMKSRSMPAACSGSLVKKWSQ